MLEAKAKRFKPFNCKMIRATTAAILKRMMNFFERDTVQVGVIYALSAFIFWGVAPLYFAAMTDISALEIVVHRGIWSCIVLGIWISISARWCRVREIFSNPKMLVTVIMTAPLIMINWGVFVWSIEAERLTDASLGYFLNPLMFIIGGMIVFNERLTRIQWIAVIIASVGVAYLIWRTGDSVWIALTLALTFCIFGLARKWAVIPPTSGLFVETIFMLPVALLIFLVAPITNTAPPNWQFGQTFYHSFILIGVGVVTVLPLVWFNAGARRLPYKYMGIMQFIAPSIMFLLAIFALKEPLLPEKLHAFIAIWLALALFAGEQLTISVKERT